MAVCVCGHADDEHGGDPEYPGSSACNETIVSQYEGELNERCDCICFEEDEEAE